MTSTNGVQNSTTIEYNIHGLVGIRLINPTPSDAAAVAKQLGPVKGEIMGEADITIRFFKHLEVKEIVYLGLNTCGFNDDGFWILKSKKKKAKVRIDFQQIGDRCEIHCESGLKAVPLLLHIVNLFMVKKDCVPLHASAFSYNGEDILVTGWAKGGKSEVLLAFAQHGARYIGDEWIYLQGDGKKMHGIPENMRLWDWHLAQLPQVKKSIPPEKVRLFKSIHRLTFWLNKFGRRKGPFKMLKYADEALPALQRQLNVTMPPETIFGKKCGPFSGVPGKVFFVASHSRSEVIVKPDSTDTIARRMIASLEFELMPFMEYYLAFRFAFPDKENPFLENLPALQYHILKRALFEKEAFAVYHPYPCCFDDLFSEMKNVLSNEKEAVPA